MSRSQCLDCGSSDGLAAYSDGSYCHACHKQTPSKSLFQEQEKTKSKIELRKPVDDGKPMPVEIKAWLSQFLEEEEIDIFTFWSSTYNRVCFPYYIRQKDKNSSEMLMCWMRTLDPSNKMKWLFFGDNTILPFFIPTRRMQSPNRVCLVEDVISGVKVSKFLDTIVLGTTDISETSPIWHKLNKFEEIVLFLDGDTAGKKGSEKLRNKLKLLYNVRVIRNTKDPKNYSNEQLAELLND